MNFVAHGGVTSKNVPSNSRDALVLALHTNYIEGIAIDVHLTKDHKVVLLKQNSVNGISNGKGKIKDHSYNTLKQLNFGNKIKRQDISTLEEVLPLFHNTTKQLVIQLTDEKDPERNKSLVDEVVTLINQYPNINFYLKGYNLDMILYLNKQNTKAKVGMCIKKDDLNLETQPLDFYSICSSAITPEFIKKANEQHRLIMLENVNTKEQLAEVTSKLSNLIGSIFVITENVASLVSFYFENLNNY